MVVGAAESIHVHAMHAEEQCRSRLEVSLDHGQEELVPWVPRAPRGPHSALNHGNCSKGADHTPG